MTQQQKPSLLSSNEHAMPLHLNVTNTSNNNKLSMTIFVTNGVKSVAVEALVDSGAHTSFINRSFVQRNKIRTLKLRNPRPITNVDGTNNIAGAITHYVWIPIKFHQHQEHRRFFISELDTEDIILGIDWLTKHDPKINWTTKDISFPLSVKATFSKSQQISIANQKDQAPLQIPPNYQEFADVFSEKAAARFPKEKMWDHEINLIPGTTPPYGKVYPMPPVEYNTLKDWIEENEGKGYIRKSKSPAAAPVFFIGKRDGKLRLCQDYRKLNEITIKDRYPLPIMNTLFNRLGKAKVFTKIDLRWGYNNVRIREGDQWKAAFNTPFGLYEPLVMFFGLCNSPATFQRMMDDILKGLEGFAIVYLDDILIFS